MADYELNQFINVLNKLDFKEELLLDDIAEKAERNIKDRYGKYPKDINWQRLKPATIKSKSTGDSPLLETGELRDSNEIKKSKNERFVGSKLNKAQWMEYGVVSKNIPARPVYRPEALQSNTYATDMTEKHLEQILKKL